MIGLAIVAISDPGSLPERLAAAAGAGGVLFLAALAYPGGMGMGDVKLAAAMGLFLGVEVIPAMLIALLAGSAVGIVMIARHGVAARKRAIPFGPFLALGGVTAPAGRARPDPGLPRRPSDERENLPFGGKGAPAGCRSRTGARSPP